MWLDEDADGIQDGGEPGVGGVTVKLYSDASAEVDTKTTSTDGSYEFTDVAPGSYYVTFTPANGEQFTFRQAGSDPAKDSDGAVSDVFTVAAEDSITTIDAGLLAAADTSLPRVQTLLFDDLGVTNDPSEADSITPSSVAPRYGQSYHWRDNDVDGQIEPPENDLKIPVAYVRNTRPTATAGFKIKDPEGDLPDSIEVRGKGTAGVDFPAMTVNKNAQDLYVYVGQASAAFADTVKHYDDFQIHWEVRVGGGDWENAGMTENDVYLTLTTPASSPLYHTVVHMGSHYADGKTTEDDVIIAVWDYYKGLAIKKQDETTHNGSQQITDIGLPIKYWAHFNEASGCGDTPIVLYTGHSTCGGLAILFADVVKTQGINRQNEIVSVDDEIVVKKWKPLGPQVPGANGLVDVIVFHPIPDTGRIEDKWDAMYTAARDKYNLHQHTQLTDETGLAGQNVENPFSAFIGHAWVQYTVNGQMRWLDPSYGSEYVGDTDDARMIDFEDKGLYGIQQPDVEDLEQKLDKDLDGDGMVTDDAGMSGDPYIEQIAVERQTPGVKELDPHFTDR